MGRVLEVIFRHKIQLVVMSLAPILIALIVVLAQPRAYQATATLWALQRYSVIGATGPESDLTSTPATTQATALQELLQTRSFSLSVAGETNLADTLPASAHASKNTLNDAIYTEISTQVKVTPSSYNLYEISYNNKNPTVAKQVVAAVVDQFGAAATQFSVAEGKQLLVVYAGQLAKAQASSNAATQTASKYISQHPGATAQSDPVYSQLLTQAQGEQATVLNLQASITQLNQQLASVGPSSGGLYSIIDAPAVSDRPVSRLKTYALGGGVGLAVALLGCSIFIVLLLRQDRAPYSAVEAQQLTQLPVLMEIPYLPSAITPQTPRIRGAARGRTRHVG